MFIIPYQVSPTAFRIFLALADENIERMRVHDPAAFYMRNLGAPFNSLQLEGVAIGYVSSADAEELIRMVNEAIQAGEPGSGPTQIDRIIGWLHRGFLVKPEDHDGPPLSIRVKKGETQQWPPLSIRVKKGETQQ